MLSPSWGKLCQISSVIKGIKGCKSLRVSASTKEITFCAVSSPDERRGFTSSIYQSQKISHTKSYSFAKATPSSYRSIFSVTSDTSLSNMVRSHLSSSLNFVDSGRTVLSIVRFISTKRAAFQSLLAKLRADSIFSSEKRISFPGEFPDVSANLNASAPYLSTTSSGSIPFPRDLDILRPWASRTSPCINTCGKGICFFTSPGNTSLMFSSPMNIIFDTQKVIISYAVTSTDVG